MCAFVPMSFAELWIDIAFSEKDENEKGVVIGLDVLSRLRCWKTLLENDSKLDPKYIRPTEVDGLLGDPTKSKTQLGWEPKYN